MKKISIFVTLGFLCVLFQQALALDTVSGVVNMSFDLSSHPVGGKTCLWVPYPVSGPYQEITAVEIKGDFHHSAVYTDRKYRRPIVYAQWKQGTTARHLEFSFYVKRLERVEKDIPVQEPCWNPGDYSRFLEPARLVPTDGKIRELALEITEGCTTVREKISAIYEWTVKNMKRKPESKYCGDGDVIQLLKERRGNCVDIHSVMVALARAAGVPAREVFGIRLGKMNGRISDITKWEHCWAEYFQPGYGWVVLDPADVLKKMLVEKLQPSSEKAIKYYNYFFGAVDPLRVRFGTGRDIVLNPRQTGHPLNYLMYPYAEVDGKPLDFKNAREFKYRFIFTPDNQK